MKKRAEAGGSAQNSADEDQNSTAEEEDHPRTVERKIYRGHKTRKLRKLNDGGKLEVSVSLKGAAIDARRKEMGEGTLSRPPSAKATQWLAMMQQSESTIVGWMSKQKSVSSTG